MRARRCRYRGRFHVDGLGAVSLRQVLLLLDSGNGHKCDQDAAPTWDFGPAVIARIDDHSRNENITDLQCRAERPGEASRLQHCGMIQPNHGLGGAAGSFCADSAANHNEFVPLKKDELAAGMFALDMSPAADQAADFSLERRDQGDFS